MTVFSVNTTTQKCTVSIIFLNFSLERTCPLPTSPCNSPRFTSMFFLSIRVHSVPHNPSPAPRNKHDTPLALSRLSGPSVRTLSYFKKFPPRGSAALRPLPAGITAHGPLSKHHKPQRNGPKCGRREVRSDEKLQGFSRKIDTEILKNT